MSTKKKTWTGQEKLAIVLQGLRGNCRISELCNEHGITQGMFYRWRDQLLNDGAKLFAHGGVLGCAAIYGGLYTLETAWDHLTQPQAQGNDWRADHGTKKNDWD